MISIGSLRLEPGRKLALPLGSPFCYQNVMVAARQNDTKKKMGRPATGQGTPIMVRLQPDQLAVVDKWAEDNGGLTRPEAVRRLIERGVGRTTKVMRGS